MSFFDKQEWINAVDDLKRKAAEFTQLYNRAVSSVPQTPELAETRRGVLNRAQTIKATIENVTQGIDWTYAKWNELFGNQSDGTLQSLGLVPLVPVAAIAAAAGGVVYGIKQLKDYLIENERIQMLKAEGHTTQESLEIMRGQATGIGPSIERGLMTIGPWIAAGVVIWIVAQKKFKF